MSSFPHSLLNHTRYHNCGGTICHNAGAPGLGHSYCGRCGAFAYDSPEGEIRPLPDGTDAAANQAAYDAGDDESPPACDFDIGERVEAGKAWNSYDYGYLLSFERRGHVLGAVVSWEGSLSVSWAPVRNLRPYSAERHGEMVARLAS